jgi:hypothetical protein
MGFQFNNQLQTKEIRIGRKGRGSKERKKKRQAKKESTPQYPHCGECIACYRVDN